MTDGPDPRMSPRVVLNSRAIVDWNTCGQAAIATVLAYFHLGPFALEADPSDAEAIDAVCREFGPDLPFGLGTSAFRIAAALRTHGLGVEISHSDWLCRGSADAYERLCAHVAHGIPVPVCLEAGRLAGRRGSLHWAVALGADPTGVRLGNALAWEQPSAADFVEAWRCRLLPAPHHHAAVLAWA